MAEKKTALLVLVVLAVCATFAGIVDNAFVMWDDYNYLVLNRHVWGLSWENLLNIFTTFRNGNYHPLPLLSYALEYEFFQLAPAGYHLVSLFWHVAMSSLVFLLLQRLGLGVWPSFWASLFFALHPMRVEAVAWVTGRKDLMSGVFSAGALLLHIKWLKSHRPRDYTWGLILLLLALLAKGTALVLPLLLLVVDKLVGRNVDWRAVREKAPHFILAGIFLGIAFWARSSYQDVLIEKSYGLVDSLALGPYRLVFYYFLRTCLPLPHLFSPYPPSVSLLDFWVLLPIVTSVLLLAALLYWYRTGVLRTAPVFGLLFFVVALAPALFLPVVGYSADRFSYLPSVGMAFTVGWGIEWARGAWRVRWTRLAGVACLALVIATLAVLTKQRCQVWSNSVSLYSDSITLFDGKNGQQQNLARSYLDRGVAYREQGAWQAAYADIARSLELEPGTPRAWLYLGEMQAGLGRLDAALASYSRSIDLDPEKADAWTGRSVVLRRLGQLGPALSDAETAMRISPGEARVHNARGMVLKDMGRLPDALASFAMVVSLAPDRVEGYLNRGSVYAELGQRDNAVKDFAMALQLDPENQGARQQMEFLSR